MTDTKRNALAELAEELNRVDAHEPELWVGHRKAVRKAQRIIAELANRNISMIPQDCYGCGVLKTLANCRVIAEDEE